MPVSLTNNNPYLKIIWGTSLIFSVYSIITVSFGEWTSDAASILFTLSFNSGVALWTVFDKSQWNYQGSFDFGAYMFFLWAILLPFYLYRTRKWKGIGLFVIFLGLFYSPHFCSIIVYWINYNLS